MRIHNLIFAICITLLSSGCSVFITQQEKENIQQTVSQAQNSKIIILDVYHNRCKVCKVIEPIMKELQTNHSTDKDLAFLKYDISNPFTIYKGREIAKGLGIENIYKSQRYSGIVLFIDTKNKNVMEVLIGEESLDNYNKVIKENLNKIVAIQNKPG